ncbi:PrpF domain-containing protein [Streptomyces canarius]
MLRLHGEMIRGGTSKCWIFDHRDVAATGVDVDALLLAAFNAADPRQIDGVGGASSTTSKAAVVQASAQAGVDVEYAFAQVGIGDERVEWASNCGNCATAVALYAVHHDLVPITSDTTTVRMLNVNTGARLTGTIPTPAGVAPEEGTAMVPGTSAPGVPVLLGFQDPAGSTTGRALPTGRALDELTGPDGPVEASLVDAGAPAALFEAKAFGLDGTESPTAFAAAVPALTLLRRQAALAMGLAREGDPVSHAVPKAGIVARPRRLPYPGARSRRGRRRPGAATAAQRRAVRRATTETLPVVRRRGDGAAGEESLPGWYRDRDAETRARMCCSSRACEAVRRMRRTTASKAAAVIR